VTVPASGATLSFWYRPYCPDTITYDQQQAFVGTTRILNVCSNSGAWTQVTQSLTSWAGQSVSIAFTVKDDGYAADPSYMLVDDVKVE
jgi:hypothetical protein